MAIIGVCGLPGSGKTLFLVRHLMRRKRQGYLTLANFHSKRGLWDYALWEDMIQAGNALCAIDEAHVWFGSRAWKGQGTADLAVFQQSRKAGLDLYWSAQHRNRVDVAIREVTHFFWQCRKAGPFIVAKCEDPDTGKMESMEVFPIKWYANQYFTEEIIGDREGKGSGFGVDLAHKKKHSRVCVIPPNIYRVEYPSFVRYVKEEELGEAVSAAVDLWGGVGRPGFVRRCVTPLYRSADGSLFVVDSGGVQALRTNWQDKVQAVIGKLATVGR